MVKCSECGFIASRVGVTREFLEIDDRKRESGGVGSWYGPIEPIPVCFVNRFNIGEEVKVLRKGADDEVRPDAYGQIAEDWEGDVKQVLNRERVCEDFINWQQGFSPKEHREMVERKRMQEWEMRREEADRKWRMEEEKRRSRDEWKRYVFLAIMTIVAGVVGVVVGYML